MNTVDLEHGRGWLDDAAAASIRRIDRELGHPLQITEAGRSWDQQNVHFQHYLRHGKPIALDPDTPSVHQEGEAIDSDEAQQFIDLMERHGWKRTVYRDGKLIERWHFEYFIDEDQHRNDPDPSDIIAQLGDPMSLRIIDSPFYRAAGYAVIHNGSAATSVKAGILNEMTAQGRVEYVQYDDDNLLDTEVNLVWQLGGLDAKNAAEKTAEMLAEIENKRE